MMKWETFSAEVSPAIVLLDVQGRRNPVLTPDRAEAAIALANQMQALGGSSRTTTIDAEPGTTPQGPCLVLYYRSRRGRATKGEIARVARIIARSEVREPGSPLVAGRMLYVTGSRAVVYPEVAAAGSDSVVFLVSTRIWYNVCAVSAPLILRIPGLGGLCHLSVEADGEAIWQMVEKVLLVGARLLSLGAETGAGQTR